MHEGFQPHPPYSGVQPGVSGAESTTRSVLVVPSPQTTAPRFQATAPAPSSGIGLLTWLFYFYWFGVVVFGANFLLQIFILFYQCNRNPVIRDGRFRIVEIAGDHAPCSFGNSIFINPLYDPRTFARILIHEKVHVSGRHTIDILLAEMVVVLQRFNPFRMAIPHRKWRTNFRIPDFDQSVLQHREVERSAYQLSLLRVSAPCICLSASRPITINHFLKKRIVMMNSHNIPLLARSAKYIFPGSSARSRWFVHS